MESVLRTCFRRAYLGIAIFGLVSHLLLLMGAAVPWPLFPMILAGTLSTVMFLRQPAGDPGAQKGTGLAALLVAVPLGICLFPLFITCYQGFCPGIDGILGFTPRAVFLAWEPTLDQPPFTDPYNTYTFCWFYPLLQPLLTAPVIHVLGNPAGIVILPLLYMLFVGFVWSCFRDLEIPPLPAALYSLALGLTPMLLTPVSASIDSGMGEFLLLFIMTGAAFGIARQDIVLTMASLFLLPLTKPEGLAYGFIICLSLCLSRRKRLPILAVLSFCLSLQLWLPIQCRLALNGKPLNFFFFTFSLAVIVALFWLFRLFLSRKKPAGLNRILLVLALLSISLLLYVFSAKIGFIDSSFLKLYLPKTNSLDEGFAKLPTILHSYSKHVIYIDKYGFVFFILLLLILLPRNVIGPCPDYALALMIILGFLILGAPFFLTSPEKLESHLHSRMDRLFLHWVGPTWVLVGLWLSQRVLRKKPGGERG